jgi:hypothetical protein
MYYEYRITELSRAYCLVIAFALLICHSRGGGNLKRWLIYRRCDSRLRGNDTRQIGLLSGQANSIKTVNCVFNTFIDGHVHALGNFINANFDQFQALLFGHSLTLHFFQLK